MKSLLSLVTGIGAVLGLAACADDLPDVAPASPASTAPRADSAALRDALGRPAYIVALRREATASARLASTRDPRFAAYHDAAALGLVHAVEADHAVAATGLVSQVALAFRAYLDDAAVAALSADPRVLRVERDQPVALSSALWTDEDSPPAFTSWGTFAVGSVDMTPPPIKVTTARPRVYVLDSGVAQHPDLNLVRALNALDPTVSLPGCYAHATHVAGIIGARADGQGTRGVAAGVELVSVSVLDPTGIGAGCLESSAFYITEGLDRIRVDLAGHDRAGIVNLSSNRLGDITEPRPQTLLDAANALTRPTPGYRGALLVQSAGNQGEDACDRLLVPHADGITLVVGAINAHGQPVRMINGVDGFDNGTAAQSEPGSNYGVCVDAWAPGQRIRSTWSGGGYEYLSGTSMAAPHVAGLAATLVAKDVDATMLESAVRATFQALDTAHPAAPDRPISIPSLVMNLPEAVPYVDVRVTDVNPAPEMQTLSSTLTTYDYRPVQIFIDSTGAPPQGCEIHGRRSPSSDWQMLGTAAPSTTISLSPFAGTWELGSPECPSLYALVTSKVTPRWIVDGVPQPPLAGPDIHLPASTPAPLVFARGEGTGCEIAVYRFATPASATPHILPGYPQAVTSATISVPAQPPGRYEYGASCTGPLAFATSFRVTIEAAIAPTNGHWWNPARSGNGFDLRLRNDVLHLVWFTYRANGTPVWYAGALSRNGSGWRGAIEESHRDLWSGAVTRAQVGTATFTPSSTTTGTLSWTVGAASDSESLERFDFGGTPTEPLFAGPWHDPLEDGWRVMVDTQGPRQLAHLAVFDEAGDATWVHGVATDGGTAPSFDLVRTYSTTLCPGCGGTPDVQVFFEGTMTADLTRLGSDRAEVVISAALGNGTWTRFADLARP